MALGERLGKAVPGGTVIALRGGLGAGKTTFAKGLARGLGVEDEVTSPTYTIVSEYEGRLRLHHIDAYRLRDEDEFLALGPDEYFDSNGLVLIEWADRVEGCLPRERIEVHVEVTGPQSRRFEVRAIGPRYEQPLAQLAIRLRESHRS